MDPTPKKTAPSILGKGWGNTVVEGELRPVNNL